MSSRLRVQNKRTNSLNGLWRIYIQLTDKDSKRTCAKNRYTKVNTGHKKVHTKQKSHQATKGSVVRREKNRPFFGNTCTRCMHPLHYYGWVSLHHLLAMFSSLSLINEFSWPITNRYTYMVAMWPQGW